MPNAKYFKYDEEYNLIPIYNDDVVEVVRCKDCKKYKPYENDNFPCGECGNCSYDVRPRVVGDNDYCSDAERR